MHQWLDPASFFEGKWQYPSY